jgi:diacylglycerol kinase (ATP)
VAIGGDGTVAGVLDQLYRSGEKIPVAIVPTGTSNLLARSLGVYPTTVHRSLFRYALDLYFFSKPSEVIVESALNTIRHGRPVELDLAKVNDKLMVTSVNVGPVASATAAPDSSTKKRFGMFAYIAAMLKQSREASRKFLIRIDDEDPIEAEAMGILVSNLPNFGIGTPEDMHEAQDGVLDLFVVDCKSPRQYFGAFWKYLRWIFSNDRIPPYLFRHVKRVRATTLDDSATPSLNQATITVDGDFAANGTLDVEVLPRAVAVYVPPWVAAQLRPQPETVCEVLLDPPSEVA